MDWLLAWGAGISIIKATLILASLAFFFLDILIRGGFGIRTEDAGADLCLAAISFNAATMLGLFDQVQTASGSLTNILREALYRSFAYLLLSFCLWVVCLRLTTSRRHRSFRLLSRTVEFNPSHLLANLIGALSFVLVVFFFVEV